MALEFMSSKYVFYGKAISKEYAEDKLTYSVVFEVIKHYKESESPLEVRYILPSYDGSSCGWEVNLGENWLIFSKIENERNWRNNRYG